MYRSFTIKLNNKYMRSKLFLSILAIFLAATSFSQELNERSLTGKWIPSAIKLPSGIVELNADALSAVYGKDQAAGILEMKKSVYLFKKNTYELGTDASDKGTYAIKPGKKMHFINTRTKTVTEASVWFEKGMLVVQTTLEDGAKQTVYYKKAE